ncbi:amino acid adenylation domain-containing protein [Micromonospora sediminicola]|uniref:Amino acid adenylation domain-containing protein n=1 Tax=Micromonospora sediminicola TaxID=946078 RepID=A0A1A9B9R9_9ACTN|nr:non-ribosomal peptide synthetase [Micromonospora sediminicola]SBT65719.1 amino acid adenylation domain-containing protein [Micromonospora sediminicola]
MEPSHRPAAVPAVGAPGTPPTPLAQVTGAAAAVLALDPSQLRELATGHSFASLGGSSLNAVQLVAEAAHLGWHLELADLISREPLAHALRSARPAAPSPRPASPATPVRLVLPGQAGMLRWDDRGSGRPYHLLFTADIRDGGGPDRVAAAVGVLTARHESLRTMFLRHDIDETGFARRVEAVARPRIARQVLRTPPGTDMVDAVNRQLAAASGQLVKPFHQVPVFFQITEDAADPRRLLLSLLCHHALLDGWSVNRLFRELADELAGAQLPEPVTPELLRAAGPSHDVSTALLERRVAQLRGVPAPLEMPSDLARPERQEPDGHRLTRSLSRPSAQAWRRFAGVTGISRTAVLLAAWALVLARRTAMSDLLIGVPIARRQTPDLAAAMAYATNLVPVRCRIDDDASISGYLAGVADDLADAVRAADVPFERLHTALGGGGDRRRAPLVQMVVAPEDELIQRRIESGPVRVDLYEGHCGGTPFDTVLFVGGSPDEPTVVCEYATSVLTPYEAAELLDALDHTLVELHRATRVGEVRTISEPQRQRLCRIRQGPPTPPDSDVWQLVRATAARLPEVVAVRDEQGELTYRELMDLAGEQARELRRAGVGANDVVAVAVRRSCREAVAVLAALRLGAAYVGLDLADPERRIREVIELARPAAVLTDHHSEARLQQVAPADLPRLRVRLAPPAPADDGAGDPGSLPEPAMDPERIIYLTFTSGSTGAPKGVRVRHGSVVRLVSPDLGDAAVCVEGDRMLRISPLAFDLSPIELFGPLAVGATVEVHPEEIPTAAGVAEHLDARDITVAWITAGLFRLVARHRPDCFRRMRYVMSGGEAVDPDAVRAVLTHSPGVRVVNGYGPSENATFTTTHPVQSCSDLDHQTPIGTAVPGTGVLVLDESGRVVPPGGIGELVATGAGLAVDYHRNPEATAATFGRPAPDTGERAYRTGDLVRLDGYGRLRYLGRNDHQVKVGGIRIELGDIRARLLECPGVAGAAVVAVPQGPSNTVLAAVVPDGPATVAEWRDRLAAQLPPAGVPSLWAIVAALPLTVNGKTDAAALERVARPIGALLGSTDDPEADVGVDGPSGPPASPAPDGAADQRHRKLAESAWHAVLGAPPSSPESDFFAAGGDSLLMTRLMLHLRRQHAIRIRPRDFYSDPTMRHLVACIARAEVEQSGDRDPRRGGSVV